MNRPGYLITGATGLVGSHVAEACIQRGCDATAIVRPGSDAGFLEASGVRIVRGDFAEPAILEAALAGVGVVVHCAAKVGDWGPVDQYRAVNVEGTRHLLEAVRKRPLGRFVHLSSLGVYEARHHFGTDESVPIPDRHMDGYTQSKVESEKLVMQYHREHGVPVVVLRPGFIYGPRDRTVLPRLIALLCDKQVRYLGDGSQALNTIYVGNVVDAVFLAAEKPEAVGEIFNLTDDEPITKRRFIEAIADLAGLERPRRRVPLWLARFLARLMEGTARLFGAKQPPRLTQARIKFLGLNLGFSCEKAKQILGYRPRVKFEEGIEEAVAWWKSEQEKPQATRQPAAEKV